MIRKTIIQVVKLTTIILLFSIPFFETSCEKGTHTIHLSGYAIDENGIRLENVKVKVDDNVVYTDVNGYFNLETFLPSDKRAIIQASHYNCMSRDYGLYITESSNFNFTIVLGRIDQSTSLSTTNGGTITLNSGAKVIIPANGVTLENGAAYNGNNIHIQVKEINDNLGEKFPSLIPGNTLSAIDINGNNQELFSYGMLQIELSGDNGEQLQIKDGESATLEFIIPTSQLSTAPTSIPLWYFDKTSAIWKEEGTATKQGNKYIGTVNHFSTWNVDVPRIPCTVGGCVVDKNGNPLSNLEIQVGQIVVLTNQSGCFHARLPSQIVPIHIRVLNYLNKNSCELANLKTPIQANAHHNFGNLVYSNNCGNWDVYIPSGLIGQYNQLEVLRVSIKDSLGHFVTGVSVEFNITQGGGFVSSTEVQTNNYGEAEIDWTFGSSGSQQLVVEVDGIRRFVNGVIIQTGTMTDQRDGKIYNTVTYNGVTWLAENLDYEVPGNPSLDTLTPYSQRLYDWETVINGEVSSPLSPSGIRGICPQDWHLPSDLEWQELQDIIGVWHLTNAMKTTYGWANPNIPFTNANGTNISGFSAYPAGFYDGLIFKANGHNAYFWTCTEYDANYVVGRNIYAAATIVSKVQLQKQYGFSCRCVKD